MPPDINLSGLFCYGCTCSHFWEAKVTKAECSQVLTTGLCLLGWYWIAVTDSKKMVLLSPQCSVQCSTLEIKVRSENILTSKMFQNAGRLEVMFYMEFTFHRITAILKSLIALI